jgi:predicted amidohydrolase YtcJ
VYGSDWPAAAVDANPWLGLAGMVTRKHPLGLFEGAVGADQAITLDQALPLFTRNAARAMGLEQRTGMLRAGLSADFVVIESSIGEMSPRELASVRPLRTVFEGRTVFER